MEQTKCSSTDEWIDDMWCVHTVGYYSTIRRNEMLTRATTGINLENFVLSEISQFKRTQML